MSPPPPAAEQVCALPALAASAFERPAAGDVPSAAAPAKHANPHPRPWWREPYVWLVLAGPIAVILACIATAVVVLRAPDPLVDADYYRQGLEINKRMAQQTGQATYLPAHQARNHAATAGVPPQVKRPDQP